MVFHAYINEMHSSRSKIPKISSGNVVRRDLILALRKNKLTAVYVNPIFISAQHWSVNYACHRTSEGNRNVLIRSCKEKYSIFFAKELYHCCKPEVLKELKIMKRKHFSC
jgi:hypothetical protein